MNPLISIIICTYNNSHKLKQCLASILNAENPSMVNYEAIVINNNSSDNTEEVVKAASQYFGGKLRYYFEEKQGTSYARNRGIKEAKGGFVAFIDDDVIVDKNWLIEIVKNLQFLGADCIAGKIIPKWEIQKPKWLTDNLRMALGLLDYGDKAFLIKSNEYQIVTANFIARRNIFDNKNYLFKTYLGDKGKEIIKGEDTELFFNLMKGGYKIWYVPSALVQHDIPKERMRVLYFLKWNFCYGETLAYLGKLFLYTATGERKNVLKERLKIFINCIKTINKSYIELLSLFVRHIGLVSYRILKKR